MSDHFMQLQIRSRDPKSKRYYRRHDISVSLASPVGMLFHRMLGLEKVTLHWSDGGRSQYARRSK